MYIFDRPGHAKSITYEQAWVLEVRSAWEKANESGEAVTTGLAIGIMPIICGREIGSHDVTVANNLYSNVAAINAALKAQGAQEIITSNDSSGANRQLTATEDPSFGSAVHKVDFTDGDNSWNHKGFDPASSRPIALQIAPDLI